MRLSKQLVASLTDLLIPELRDSSNICQQLAARLRTVAAALESREGDVQFNLNRALQIDEPGGQSPGLQLAERGCSATEALLQPGPDAVLSESSKSLKRNSMSWRAPSYWKAKVAQ